MALKKRPFWLKKIHEAWKERSIIWLMGLRRVGKTSLCQSMDDIEYYDCELPRIRSLMSDPEAFLDARKGKRIVLDEIHRLDNPSELLKIAADYHADTKIIATGSSTLGASKKFKDVLTGRKRTLWLTPLLLQEMEIFGNEDLRHRFLFGGFPSLFSKTHLSYVDYVEWFNEYWAKDVEDIFSVGKKSSFQKFAELLLANSGGMFEATRYAASCEVTRPTISAYLDVLEATFVVHIVRPFSSHKPTEIVSAPKIYGLDTGFVCHFKHIRELRNEDLGFMWEHCVLNELHGQLQTRAINYWRTKQGHEIDFIIRSLSDNTYTAIECKFSSNSTDKYNLSNLKKNFEAFRKLYPTGENFVVASNVDTSFTRTVDGVTITFISIQGLIDFLHKEPLPYFM